MRRGGGTRHAIAAGVCSWYLFRVVESSVFRDLVRSRLRETGLSASRAATRAGLPRDAIRSVLRGHPPGVTRAAEICAALGIELRLGANSAPLPGSPDTRLAAIEARVRELNQAILDAGGNPFPPTSHAPALKPESSTTSTDD